MKKIKMDMNEGKINTNIIKLYFNNDISFKCVYNWFDFM
jgi:hypothetical protein